MKNLFLTVTLGLLVASCSSVQVSSDHDRDANFASYKTYAFTKEAQELPVNDLNRKRLIAAVTNELAAKGFSKSENPDVLVDLVVATQEKQTATATNSGTYGAGYRYGWGGGFSTTTINVENYTEGTLFIDLVDASKKQLVWQGRGVGTLNPEASSEKREANINAAVKQIFTKYPPK
jgi:FlaG/FlaF family flagellin (archaellin)